MAFVRSSLYKDRGLNKTKQKFYLLWIICLISMFFTYLWVLICLLCCALLLYPLSGYKLSVAFKNLRFVFWVMLFIFICEMSTKVWHAAFTDALRIYVIFLYSYLMSITTRMSEFMDMFEDLLKGLKYFSIDPAKLSFTLALIMRIIPLFIEIMREVQEAQYARGGKKTLTIFFVPMLTRIILMHEETALALEARCYPPKASIQE